LIRASAVVKRHCTREPSRLRHGSQAATSWRNAAALPRGGAAQGDQVGLEDAVHLGRHRRVLPRLPFQGGLFTAGNETLTEAGDGVDVRGEGLGDLGIGPGAVGAVVVGPKQDLGVADLLGGGVAVAGEVGEMPEGR
jgi:hypothetical protein